MERVYIFGPSCSGKSTLCKALQQRLGDQWTYLDRDQLIEEGFCIESEADKTLEERIRVIGNKIIVDAQIPWKQKEQEGEFYCLLLPPLAALIERDAQRTKRLKRLEQRAIAAQKYVVDTYDALKAIACERFDVCFDSSLLSVEEMVLTDLPGENP